MKPPRNYWPIGIAGVFVVFFAATVCLVVLACSHATDLVSPDYYEQELRFQTHLDQANRTRDPGHAAVIAYEAQTRRITVALPDRREPASGRIELYRPSAAGLDRRFDLRLDAAGQQALDASDLAPGLWKVRVRWTTGSEEFFSEQPLIVDSAVRAPRSSER